MNIAMILAAVLCGFVGGVLGAMVLHEVLDQKFEKKKAEDAQQYAVINHKLEQANTKYKTVTIAIEQLTRRYVKDRGAIWESLNGLWNDYDERHKKPEPEQSEQKPEQTDAEPVTEGTETGKKRTKKANKENNTDEAEHAV